MNSQEPAAPTFRLNFGVRLVLLLVALLAVAAFIPGVWRFKGSQSLPALTLPDDAEISEIRAKLNDCLDQPGVAEFTVPLESVPGIMSCLRPPRYNTEPWPADDRVRLGQLRSVLSRARRWNFVSTGLVKTQLSTRRAA